MRTLVLAGALLAACTPQAQPAAAPGADPLAACDGSKANPLLGRPVDAALQREAMQLVGARTVRVIAPGMMVTMDYRTDRLNIDIDNTNRATAFRCG